MKNYIVICIDCLRYDYSDKLITLNSFNDRLLKFNRAYSTAPWTYPSTNSILTGLYPYNHGAIQTRQYKVGVQDPWPRPLNDNVPTLFSELKKHGYYTFGISTIFWALNEQCQYEGADHIIRSEEQDIFYKNVKAEWVIDKCKSEIKECKAPFFSYLHLSDLHRPYDLNIATECSSDKIDLLGGIEEWDIRPYSNHSEFNQLFKTNKRELYANLIKYIDMQLRDLIQFLIESNRFNNTTFFITSDHGEEFWEHQAFETEHYDCGRKSRENWLLGTGHGHTLFEEIIHVPLFVLNPEFNVKDHQINIPVSLIDIFPTIMKVVDGKSKREVDGIPFDDNVPDRCLLSERTLYGYERKALIKDNRKYIASPFEDNYIMFDNAMDPFDKQPVFVTETNENIGKLMELF